MSTIRKKRIWYPGATYHAMARGIRRITQTEKTLAYFKNSVFHYREFVEDAIHKYVVSENDIRKEIGEDETWLPW